MKYPHRLIITRAGENAGVLDYVTGVWTPAAQPDDVVYDGEADVQDAGESIARGASGMPQLNADATAFLRHEEKLYDIEPGMPATVIYSNGRAADGQVQFVRVLDGTVLLRLL